MNLVRRARILNILLAHMTNAADEIERVLFERVLDKRHANQDNASLILFVVSPAQAPDAEVKP